MWQRNPRYLLLLEAVKDLAALTYAQSRQYSVSLIVCVSCSQDTFLDADHVRESFPGHRVEVVNNSGQPAPVRPFRVIFPDPPADADTDAAARSGAKRKAANGADAADGVANGGEAAANRAAAAELPLVRVESYKPPDPGPYPQDEPPQNTVRFTPVQVEAIRAGAQPGLTMVVGPPGAKVASAPKALLVRSHWQADVCALACLDVEENTMQEGICL